MSDLSCLDERYSTTRMVSKSKLSAAIQINELFETCLFLEKKSSFSVQGGLRTRGGYKNNSKMPLLTIITAVFNGENHLEETILSVLNQSYNNVEFIIIDGGSTDGTLDIIKKYDHAIDYWISEKDSGISDAFNKGIRVASGDYINFQGDGDGFYSTDSLSKIIQNLNLDNVTFISGRIQRVGCDGSQMYLSAFIPKFNKKSLLFRMSMPHQGLFTSIKYFKEFGLFDVNNKYCMDYEHLLRSYKKFPEVCTRDIIVAKWRADGLGNNRDLEIFDEYHKIKVDNKVSSFLTLNFIKYFILFKYYLKKVIK